VPVDDAVDAIVSWIGSRDNRSPGEQTFEVGPK
jgi:hypothetical protein